jgi:hypothetical protein
MTAEQDYYVIEGKEYHDGTGMVFPVLVLPSVQQL